MPIHIGPARVLCVVTAPGLQAGLQGWAALGWVGPPGAIGQGSLSEPWQWAVSVAATQGQAVY